MKKKENKENEEMLYNFELNTGNHYRVNLELERGINDDFYYARQDNGGSSDTLMQVKVYIEGSNLECRPRPL